MTKTTTVVAHRDAVRGRPVIWYLDLGCLRIVCLEF